MMNSRPGIPNGGFHWFPLGAPLAIIAAITLGCGKSDSPSVPVAGEESKVVEDDRESTPRRSIAACGPALDRLVEEVRRDRGLAGDSVTLSLETDHSSTITSGELAEPFARSTIKVPILVQLLRLRGGPDGLTLDESETARRMIVDSDNQAAAALYALLAENSGTSGAAAAELTELLRAGRSSGTTVPSSVPPGLPSSFISSYGATLWSTEDEVRFLAALSRGDLLDDASRDFVLDLMGGISPLGGGAWGLGTLPSSYRAKFKPGWGDTPSGSFLARQGGTVGPTARIPETAVALAASAPSQEEAYETVTQMAQGLADILGGPCSPEN